MTKRMILIVALGAMPVPAVAQLKGIVPLDIRVPKNPIPVVADGRLRMVYELRVTNVGRTGLRLKRVDVSADGALLAGFEGDSLKNVEARMGETGDGRVVGAGKQILLYLLVSAPLGAAPKVLNHRFLVARADSADGPAPDTLTGYSVRVEARTPPVLRSPLTDGPWVVANGPGNTSGHRRTAIPLEGQARIAQRFATDWVMLGPDGRGWKGDSTKNQNWYGYGQPLHAAGAGTVVAAKDGILENVPFSPTMAVAITLETVAGNHVILDLGNGNFAFYAHLIPGSELVKVGDRVSAGQVIGRLGNSGNSTGPHLHFHLGDSPTPLASEGVPFVVDEYWDLGATSVIFEAWTASGPPVAKRRELPFENHVIRFKPAP